ncbi:MAG: peptidylprolyl isomerase [Bacteroidales bacterium]|nr:peptidylprolyl isomerase [Bacteroidales bacterium]
MFVTSCKKEDDEKEESLVPVVYQTILIRTDFGDIRIWLYDQTPQHQANFIKLAGEGFYDSLIFHRVVEDFVIQGGDPEGTGYGGPGYNIPAEIVTSLSHQYGAVGAARLPDNINPDRESNGSQFYIVCDPDGEPSLNTYYTVFGMVFSGMDAVDSIAVVPVDEANNHRPYQNVYMTDVKVEEFTADEMKNQFGFTLP